MVTTASLPILLLLTSVTAQTGKLWREDGLCGVKGTLADGKTPAQCNPEGDGPRQGPCCSNRGFCGNTKKHCECKDCKDFSKVTPKETCGLNPDTGEIRQAGDSWAEGCNRCRCLPDYKTACTKKLCLEGCKDREEKPRKEGENWEDEGDGCSCRLGQVTCTPLVVINDVVRGLEEEKKVEVEEVKKNLCGVDKVTGEQRKVGDSWKEDCNRCKCLKNNKPGCTKQLCFPQEKGTGVKSIVSGEGSEETIELSVTEGHLRGRKIVTKDGVSSLAFRGIPFATPPTGRLRFKSPLPVENWKGTLEATKDGPKCLQKDFFTGSFVGSEDCLYLNVFTKKIKPESGSIPVMVWIHGDGFVGGSASDYNPTKLIEEDVIVVTINYRLGGLGFLTFGNDKVSGNMGLRDQAEAIQWVKRNIQYFGGDAKRITIFGESAGGISVHAQVLSPKNYGQLAGAICQSGTMASYGVLPSQGKREEQMAVDIAKNFNCSENLDQSTLFCLQQVPDEELVKGMQQNPDIRKATGSWRPVIDNYASDPFLPLSPLVAMKSGVFNRIPFISGTVRNDGWFLVEILKSLGINLESSDSVNMLAKLLYLTENRRNDPTQEEILLASILQKYYSPKKNGIRDMATDSGFLVPDQLTVRTMSKHNPSVFNYHFTQKTNNSFLGDLLNLTYADTPHHADDVKFLFDLSERGGKKDFSADEQRAEEFMIKLWTNFAKFGHPTPDPNQLPMWTSVNTNSGTPVDYMDLSSAPIMKTSLHPERMLLWNKLIWAPREQEVEKDIVFRKAAEFLAQELNL